MTNEPGAFTWSKRTSEGSVSKASFDSKWARATDGSAAGVSRVLGLKRTCGLGMEEADASRPKGLPAPVQKACVWPRQFLLGFAVALPAAYLARKMAAAATAKLTASTSRPGRRRASRPRRAPRCLHRQDYGRPRPGKSRAEDGCEPGACGRGQAARPRDPSRAQAACLPSPARDAGKRFPDGGD